MARANTTVTLPIPDISIANTTPDLVTRVQTVVDYLNQNPIGDTSANSENANNADYLDGQHGSYYTNASNLGTGTLPNGRLSANVPLGDLSVVADGYYLKYNGSAWVSAAFPVGGVASFANDAGHLNGQDPSYYTNASNLDSGTVNAARLSGVYANVTANNSTYAFGKTEGALNANSANNANNSTYAYGKTEGNLNVNSANYASNAGVLAGKTEGNLNVNSAAVALSANNSSYLGGKLSGDLNVNSALYANNSTYAYGKTEGNLNVNSAVNANTANNSTYAYGKTEGNLNVNSAVNANNSSYAYGKTEGNLNVNSAVNANTANNSTYAFGKTEGNLNVNSAVNANTANNATNAYGKTEINLNVNSAVNANTANNSTYAFGKTEGNLNVNNATTAYGKAEGALNVNSASTAGTANNSTYAFGKTEANLNVNSAVNANTANNSTNLGGRAASYYTNASNLGSGTLPDARLSSNVVVYNASKTANYVLAAPDGAAGNPTFRALTSTDVLNLDERISDMNPYGFAVIGDAETTISFNASTYTFTLANTSAAAWYYFSNGLEYKCTGPRTVVLPGSPPANGTYFLYINGATGQTATLIQNTTSWTLGDTDGIVPVAAILWNNSNTPKFFFGDERHSAGLTRALHRYLHTTQGTQYITGGVPFGQTYATVVNTALTFGTSNVVIADEDLQHAILGLPDGDGATNAYTIMFRTNTSSWTWEPSEVPFRYTAAGYIQYDLNGTMTQGGSANYYTSYLVVTNLDEGPSSNNQGWIILPGRGQYGSLAAAQAENPATFDFTGLGIAEAIILYQMVWLTKNSNGTKGKVSLEAMDLVQVGLSTAAVGAPLTDHNLLSGLQGGVAGEYFHLTSAQYANGITANNSTYAFGKSEGNLNVNSANNATYAYGKTEGNLNVNSAVNANTANNATNAYGKTEGNLNVNSAVNANTANNATNAFGKTEGNLNVNAAIYLNSKTEGNLNVNSAVNANTANNATNAFGKTEINLNVNNAVTSNTANNSTYAFGKTEGNLNVNSAVNANTANNATNAYGKTEINLNVNNAVTSNTANNATNAFGKTEGNLNVNNATTAYGKTEGNLNVNNATMAYGKIEGNLNVNSAVHANDITGATVNTNSSAVLVGANCYINTSAIFTGNASANIYLKGAAVYANNSTGSNGFVLTSNGTVSYWASAGSTASAYYKFDTLSPQFNGAQTIFTLQQSGINIAPGSSKQVFISLAGTWQEPDVAFTISGNTVNFTTAPPTGTPFFGTMVGGAVDIGNITPGVDINPRNVWATGNLSVTGLVTFATPATPASLVMTESGDTVQVKWNADTTQVDTFEVWGSQTSNTAGFSLISQIPAAGWVNATSFIVDATYLRKTTTWYKVYGVKAGVRSAALLGNVALTHTAAAVTGLTATPTLDTFIVSYALPVDRLLSGVTIYKDANTVSGNLAEGAAVLVYSGGANTFIYAIPDADLEKYHKFWVTTVTTT